MKNSLKIIFMAQLVETQNKISKLKRTQKIIISTLMFFTFGCLLISLMPLFGHLVQGNSERFVRVYGFCSMLLSIPMIYLTLKFHFKTKEIRLLVISILAICAFIICLLVFWNSIFSVTNPKHKI